MRELASSSNTLLAQLQIHAPALLPSSIFSDHFGVTFSSSSSALFSGEHPRMLFFILMRALAARTPSLIKSLRSFPHSVLGFFVPFPFLGRRVGFFSGSAGCGEDALASTRQLHRQPTRS